MFLNPILFVIGFMLMSDRVQSDDISPSVLLPPDFKRILAKDHRSNSVQEKVIKDPQVHKSQEKVKLQLYYETLCYYCCVFDVEQFAPTVKKLGDNLDVHVYPYGNAKTIVHDDGSFEIKCQHGPPECYGNMLHACAIDNLKNITRAIEYTSCMMDNRTSDDKAADECGKIHNIDSEPIKACAKSEKGLELHKYYGDESKKVKFRGVPHILINEVEFDEDDFLAAVCKVFKNPPKECK